VSEIHRHWVSRPLCDRQLRSTTGPLFAGESSQKTQRQQNARCALRIASPRALMAGGIPASGEPSLGWILNLLQVWRVPVRSALSVLYALRRGSPWAAQLPLRPPPSLSQCATHTIRMAVGSSHRAAGSLRD